MRYTQPPEWEPNVNYSEYMEREVLTDDNKKDYERIKKVLMRIPKLGAGGVDELLLKLGSFLQVKG
jgi:hypothetical protein